MYLYLMLDHVTFADNRRLIFGRALGLFAGLAGNAVEERLLLVIEHFGVGFRFGLVSLDLAFFHLVVLHVGVPIGGLRLKTAFL